MTAQDIIKKLCVPLGQRASAWDSARHDDDRFTRHAGFVAHPFSNDGYEFMVKVCGVDGCYLFPEPDQVIKPIPEAGDWPLTVLMWSPTEHALIHYCEGDVAVDVYDTYALAERAVRDVIEEEHGPEAAVAWEPAKVSD